MINHRIYSRLSINIIIILSFLLSITLSFHYLSKYDKLIKVEGTEGLIHPMIKSAVAHHWDEADEIITDIKNKKNFFEYGREYDEDRTARRQHKRDTQHGPKCIQKWAGA